MEGGVNVNGKKYILILLAIVLAVVLLTGSASRHDATSRKEEDLHEKYDPEWAHRPAIDPDGMQESFEYYSTVSIDAPPTEAELNS